MRASLSFARVSAEAGQRTRGTLIAGNLRLPCALGKSGVGIKRRDGDGVTPGGSHGLRKLWFKGGGPRPRTGLPIRLTRAGDIWCDDPKHRLYNRPAKLPFKASHEAMRRDDALYDFVIEVDWNIRPRVRGRGSAIFIHIAREGFSPTAGCVALRARDMRKLLPLIGRRTKLVVA